MRLIQKKETRESRSERPGESADARDGSHRLAVVALRIYAGIYSNEESQRGRLDWRGPIVERAQIRRRSGAPRYPELMKMSPRTKSF